ncbi:MAG: 4-(cytidine 5'-diphospho)-2-C-methyl-D-erythritol kinase [Acidobacteria bacterium]|nr:4-(cytidine 5'-diphospho)-2-C-methyl-D-erythritol kinase [Acidobacteriota bacterium]
MRIECRAYAKINWTLEVLGRRTDGYHEVRTVLQTVALHDLLRFERTDECIEITCDNPSVPVDEQNLVYRAAARLRQVKDVRAGVRAHIAKRIPVAGGLGGGSSNAAVALLTLQKLWKVPLSPKELIALGATIGSDVPFFFYGGTAIGLGRGSEVYPLRDYGAQDLLLVTPHIQVSTGEAYAAVSQQLQLTSRGLPGNIPDCCAAVFRAYGPLTKKVDAFAWHEEAGNDLEAVIVTKYLEMGRIIERLRQLGAKAVRMSGSGSTVFAAFESREAIERAESNVADEPWQVVRTRTVGREEYWEQLIREV